jgi:hypothetical protein
MTTSTPTSTPTSNSGPLPFDHYLSPRATADHSLLATKKVTLEHVKRCISSEVVERKDPTLTLVYVTLFNGTKLVGFNYGSINPEEQNWELGEQMARKQIFDEIFKLEGYQLRNLLTSGVL